MVIADKTRYVITNIQRTVLRRVTLTQVENAYINLSYGHPESLICAEIGVDPGIFHGDLQQALEEALWERGRLSPRS